MLLLPILMCKDRSTVSSCCPQFLRPLREENSEWRWENMQGWWLEGDKLLTSPYDPAPSMSPTSFPSVPHWPRALPPTPQVCSQGIRTGVPTAWKVLPQTSTRLASYLLQVFTQSHRFRGAFTGHPLQVQLQTLPPNLHSLSFLFFS